ncbi:hypothetical protein K458DRAFT_395884 [Lentithecium fluviatile CBS 122367]|uniref:Uncharacterized protein n=1 Tax=Lentithecium fluviatile CBS 122367 TaxID=1168545 RepID=A0A6G1IHA9_9PLEO|nr:hypothetical protein K458DRAFT_395884 [Lentithecium fluviatile CBS 122367]
METPRHPRPPPSVTLLADGHQNNPSRRARQAVASPAPRPLDSLQRPCSRMSAPANEAAQEAVKVQAAPPGIVRWRASRFGLPRCHRHGSLPILRRIEIWMATGGTVYEKQSLTRRRSAPRSFSSVLVQSRPLAHGLASRASASKGLGGALTCELEGSMLHLILSSPFSDARIQSVETGTIGPRSDCLALQAATGTLADDDARPAHS